MRFAAAFGATLMLCVAATGFAAVTACAGTGAASSSDVGAVLDWATKQNIRQGTVDSRPLPKGLASLSAQEPTQIAHLQDGRICVLLKTSMFGHDYSNFEGVVACTGPVLQSEIFPPKNGYPKSISLIGCKPGCGEFEQLFVRRQRDERTFDVYFDLN